MSSRLHTVYNNISAPAFTETSSTWFPLCDSQLCLIWLQPATSEYLHTSKHTQINISMSHHTDMQLKIQAGHYKASLSCLSLLPHIKSTVGILAHEESRRLYSQTKKLMNVFSDSVLFWRMSYPSLWTCVFLVVCFPALSFCQSESKKNLKWHNDTPEALHHCLTN